MKQHTKYAVGHKGARISVLFAFFSRSNIFPKYLFGEKKKLGIKVHGYRQSETEVFCAGIFINFLV